MARRKQISFDVDTIVAKKILGEQSYTKIYSDIRRFMERGGWQHIEGSVYMSKRSVNNGDILYMLDEIKEKYPYLEKCIKEIHQADVSNVHSLSQYFSYDGTPGKYEQQEQNAAGHKREPPERPSVREKLEKNKVYVKEKEQTGESGDRTRSRQDRDNREVR